MQHQTQYFIEYIDPKGRKKENTLIQPHLEYRIKT